ncbi:RNA-directed RNA polymerase [ssRNA phage SRR6050698_2]|uniref:RNA-directed RNA polymerase n=1 Tax=ssRNA phage SRR6050698_2 TaxID=2786483 RepID=A0A8S5L0R8_9VIRU|nr:RNA-directed RNA polymerase [ssRNA phage SRR6050698_2]DAD50933.1 TPA_asm: RNA-directed RNA polymerase [ssRNA phage SRR6050698_2]
MSKRHVKELSKLYQCLLKDIAIAYPTLRCEFERDLARLTEAVKQRGIHALCVDLPAAGKHLDMCLASGQYKLSGLPLTGRYSNRTVIPKLFRGLYLLIFTISGSLKGDYDHEAVFCLRQLLYAAKKTELPCSEDILDKEVIEFFAIDDSLPVPHGCWSTVHLDPSVTGEHYRGFGRDTFFSRQESGDSHCDLDGHMRIVDLLCILDRTSKILCSTLGTYRSRDWRFKHGPGAISESTRPRNKYLWENWSERLESSFPISDCGFHSYSSWATAVSTREITSEEGVSRMVSVPKTISSPRLIAVEPSENQWCQQNVWHYFRSRSASSWIGDFVRFTDQSLNQELCRKGSEDGSLATVDLSSASDRVSCEAVGQFFRSNPDLLAALRSSRTQFISQSVSRKGPTGRVALKKFSTMGNACTFPVQSMLFLSIALTATLASRGQDVNLENILALRGSVSVFGDDIIVPVESRIPFERLMKALCLQINSKKTFWTGKFRESCGVDAMHGVSVTPAYWRRPCDGKPESIASTIEVSNNFYKKWFINTAAHLASTIPNNRKIARTTVDSGICGFKSFVNWTHLNRKLRVNPELQRIESHNTVVLTTSVRISATDDSGCFQYFTENPPPFTDWESGYSLRPKLKTKLRWVPFSDL